VTAPAPTGRGDAPFPQPAIRPGEPFGGVAFQDHAATGGRRAYDQHPREHFDILVRQRDGGALRRLRRAEEGRARDRVPVPTDKSTDAGPYPNAAATPPASNRPSRPRPGRSRCWCALVAPRHPPPGRTGGGERGGPAREASCSMFCRESNVQPRAPSPCARGPPAAVPSVLGIE
jgi:hypothetical protein